MIVVISPFSRKFILNSSRITIQSNILYKTSLERNFKLIRKSDAGRLLIEKLKKDREFKLYKSRILTVPNILTLSRLALAPLFPLLVFNGNSNFAFILLSYCAATDMVIVLIFNFSSYDDLA